MAQLFKTTLRIALILTHPQYLWGLDHPRQTSCPERRTLPLIAPSLLDCKTKGWEGGREEGNTSFTTQSRRIHAAERLISHMLGLFPCHPLTPHAWTEEWLFYYGPAGIYQPEGGLRWYRCSPFHTSGSALSAHRACEDKYHKSRF